MSAWRGIVGRSFTPDAFEKYVGSLQFSLWRPRFIVVHNTSAPDLKTWRGWQARTPPITDERWAQNLVGYYRDQQHWPAGPHLFITPRGILAFSPLTGPGTHSPAWNSISWGVETVGEFEREPFTGAVRDNLVAALAILHAAAGLQPMPYARGVRGLHFHKEDPVTTHKSCPGKNMIKAELVDAVQAEILRRSRGGGHAASLFVKPEADEPMPAAPEDADEPAPYQLPDPPVGNPTLFAVQTRLKAMHYSPGLVDGRWGGGTSGAISAFINDRGGRIAAPASLDAFNEVREDIKAELDRAEAEGFVRPVTAARANADPGTVATVAPEVVPARRSFLATAWASVAAFFTAFWETISGYVSQAWDFFTDHKDDVPADSTWLQGAWDYLGQVPAAVWLVLAGAGLALVALEARKSVKKITEQVQTGARQ